MTARRPELRVVSATAPRAAHGPPTGAAEGERFVVQHGLQALRASLAGLDRDDGWSRFWRGYALQFDDLGAARVEWLLAEAHFEREGDAQGLDLVACGLLQCALLDSLSYAGFDARAERVARRAAASTSQTPLGLFRGAARLLLAVERREPAEAFVGDIEQAFSALASGVDPRIALRAATAALPMLGIALDRVRSEDFFQAGTRVASSAHVGDTARALWHVTVAEARFVDAQWAPRLRAGLDVVDRLDPANEALAPLRARAHLVRAALALGDGDAQAGRASLDAAHALLSPAHPRDYWQYHYYSSRHALLVGRLNDAWEHAQVCHRKQTDACVPAEGTTTVRMQRGHVLVALGRLDEAIAEYTLAGELSRGAQAAPCLAHAHLTRALQHWRAGALEEARAELVAGFAQSRSIELTHFFRALPQTAAELCGAAMELDADAEFARRVIAARSLECPDPGGAHWPWPLRVRALGGFTVERDGEPMKFSRKAPKRMLDLLRLVVALGARHVDAARVESTLWPDAEGDDARDALKAMLHRARALLGPDRLVVRDGQIAFDERVAWVDTWAFEHVCGRIDSLGVRSGAASPADAGELERRRLQLFALYRGHLFGEGELPAWALPLRDRLRARFVRCTEQLGEHLERSGRPDAAVALYRAALEQDNLAEEIYQRLIACHLARGERAQALNAYRRCRELLSIVLGLKPSARTDALVAGL